MHFDSFLAKVSGPCPVPAPGNTNSLNCQAVRRNPHTIKQMNSADEELAFKIFLELHGELPTGEKSVCPDFIINLDGNKIGIELTELMDDVVSQYSTPAKYAIEDKIAKSAQQKFELISSKRIIVHLQIVENLILPKHKIEVLGNQIAEILVETIKDSSYILSHHLEIIEDLPNGILGIYYDIAPFMPESHFSVWRGKWTGSFDINYLNKAISKKENNIMTYRRNVNQIYLLIIEGFSFSSYLGPFEFRGTAIDNSFDKIFLLQVMSRLLFKIK
jgi:hypothetical protein